jgi:hypothetical protein
MARMGESFFLFGGSTHDRVNLEITDANNDDKEIFLEQCEEVLLEFNITW